MNVDILARLGFGRAWLATTGLSQRVVQRFSAAGREEMAQSDGRALGARSRSRWSSLRFGMAATVAVGAMVATLIAPGVPRADAVDEYGFPTWAEVEAARGNVSAKNQQISEIRALISQLETDAVNAQALSDQRAAEAIEAQRVYDEAVAVA